ncbi:UDP-3-O-acylglucosamine N-acyltransferase [bacterium HR30]|nr:UDP-3-O-acylglucosamine N-acyltransferase [bacterium HR30]
MKLEEIARRLGCELRGPGDVEIHRLMPIQEAQVGDLTFVANPRYRRYLGTTKASAVILGTDEPDIALPSLRAANPYEAFARAIDLFFTPVPTWTGIHPTAVIHPSAKIGPQPSIGPYCVVGAGVVIGARARLEAHVVIYPEARIGDDFVAHSHAVVRERVVIGHRVVLQPGCVIGGDGFGFVLSPDGVARRITQAGTVIIEDDVDVGANTTIDRAAIGATRIHRGAKLDNLVMVAHGCSVGEGTAIAAQTGLSGSTHVGRYVRLGGQVGAAGHLTIGDGAQVAAQSGVHNDVPAGAVYGGTPAVEIRRWRREFAALQRLPEALQRLRRLEHELRSLAANARPEASQKEEP